MKKGGKRYTTSVLIIRAEPLGGRQSRRGIYYIEWDRIYATGHNLQVKQGYYRNLTLAHSSLLSSGGCTGARP
jgi:hypothetical protein